MRGVLSLLHSDSEISAALSSRDAKIIAPSPSYPFLIALKAAQNPLLVITSSSRAAEDLVETLRDLHPDVLEFPAWETLPHERLSPRSDTVAKRLATLYALQEGGAQNPIVVAPVRAVIHRFLATVTTEPLMKIEIGQEINLTDLVAHLSHCAYTRTDLVEKRGEFAVRGGIVDVFLPLSHHPIRIDFFGDEIEELQYFDISDQRTREAVVGAISILPCRELLLSPTISAKARELMDQYPQALELLSKISEGISVDGMESLIPLLTENFDSLISRLPSGSEILFLDEERIKSRTSDLLETNAEFLAASWSHAAMGADAPLPVLPDTYLSWEQLQNEIRQRDTRSASLNPFGSDLDTDTYFLDISAIDPMRGNIDALNELMRTGLEAHKSVIFATSGHGMAERYAGIFRDADLPVQMVSTLSAKPTKGAIHIVQSSLHYGFASDSAELLLVCERDLSGSKTSPKDARMPSKRKQAIDPLELKPGDFVVHEQHGIGRYVEMIARTVGGITREYLVIEYAPAKRGQPSDQIGRAHV